MAPSLLAALDTGGKFQAPPHIELLNAELVELEAGSIDRLACFMPPRHGKSYLCSTYFPAWFILRNPDKHVILASYEANFAARWGRKTRDVIKRCGHFFGVNVSDKGAGDSWETNHGGGMETCGVGGAMTGKGADLLIVDDPCKNAEEASSPTYRAKAWDWYISTARTRLEPDGRTLLIQTRWHQDDLAGKILANTLHEGWKLVNLPALAEESDPLGRKVGEALWPARFNREKLIEIRDTPEGRYWWSALYQQRPTPMGGGMVKRSWFEYFDREPDVQLRKYITADLAFTKKSTSDFTAAIVWGYDRQTKNIYALDCLHAQLDAPDAMRKIKALGEKWNVETTWVERVGAQVAAIQFMRREGIPVRELKPTADKHARLSAALPYLEGGRVFLKQGALWVDKLEEELLAFPNAAHDDLVDAFAYGVTVGAKKMSIQPVVQLR